ncbi:VOC family protein [Microbacterium pseudoresistens]|uniref:Glyoxalase/Bleomycin resistance-like N-terminal domain-containing protein n=1 Tax=Microbacterium pseudoresistens TaxID=640634 RepID=A0A7Y9EUP2_9MICO|nr:VOC family protein [Microbacterium pseudoresistens]NYD54285.1 hypothetical protein [Microbacterium pseudoresistens]
MSTVFVSLPSSDLERSKAFYAALGCEINSAFTDENAACIVWSDELCFMVLTREFFGTFTDKTLIDPRHQTQMSIGFSRDSRDDVDAIVEKGLAAGGSEPKPAQDNGFMYARDLDDPDGNSLGFMHMDDTVPGPGSAA